MNHKIVDIYVQQQLADAQADFTRDPSHHNANACLNAMLVYQQWQTQGPYKEVMAKVLAPRPIDEWNDRIIALTTEGRFNSVQAMRAEGGSL